MTPPIPFIHTFYLFILGLNWWICDEYGKRINHLQHVYWFSIVHMHPLLTWQSPMLRKIYNWCIYWKVGLPTRCMWLEMEMDRILFDMVIIQYDQLFKKTSIICRSDRLDQILICGLMDIHDSIKIVSILFFHFFSKNKALFYVVHYIFKLIKKI